MREQFHSEVIRLITDFSNAIAGTLKRFRQHIENAISNEALEQYTETREFEAYLGHAIGVFNSHADEIDRKFGKGWFGVRMVRDNAITYHVEGNRYLASVKLDYLTATDPKPVYGWMNDFLLMDALPEREIKRQATARNGFWNRVLRKRKKSIAQAQARDQADRLERQAAEKNRADSRNMLRLHNELEGLIGRDPDNIVPVGWPHRFRKGNGMSGLVPAQNVNHKSRKKPKLQLHEQEQGGKRLFCKQTGQAYLLNQKRSVVLGTTNKDLEEEAKSEDRAIQRAIGPDKK